MFDLIDPSGMLPGGRSHSANARPMLSSSMTSPTRVDVPCPSMYDAAAGERPAFFQARSMAFLGPMGLGAVIPLPRPSLAPPMPRITA